MRSLRVFSIVATLALGCSDAATKTVSSESTTQPSDRSTGDPASPSSTAATKLSATASAEARPSASEEGGLGLSGIGESGGRGEGIGFGPGGRASSHRSLSPSVRMGATTVSGRLPREVIQRIVRRNFGRFRLCYVDGLKVDPKLAGRVTVSFTITREGSIADVSASSDMTEKVSVECVRKAFEKLAFPEPEGGVVKVSFPIVFAPPAYAFTINEKASSEVTPEDVKTALAAAGYGDVVITPKADGVAMITAKKDAKVFTITFDSKDVLARQVPPTEYDRLTRDTATLKEGELLVAVANEDKVAAQALLDAIAKKTKSAP